MRLLADRHHADLFYSLQLLFEDRLGIEVYTPIGHEWWDAGYWQFGIGWGDDRLAQQFLNLDPWRKAVSGWITEDEHHPGRPIHGIDLSLARTVAWDYVLATVQDNQQGFARFASEVGAKYLYQVGNANQQIDRSLAPIVLDGAQEFDHLGTFRYREPKTSQRITSFVNLLPLIPEAWAPFAELQSLLPDHEFRSFGHECPDGFRKPVSSLADEMAEAGWAYHDKVTGDGFGHVIHNWAAVGRPLIGHARYYESQRAEPLWDDLVTCIDLDRHSIEEAAEIIQSTSPDQHEQMCRAIRDVLLTIYDPAEDAEKVRELLA
jgi:hypothetical protein